MEIFHTGQGRHFVMISDESSNAFFGFSLRLLGAELEGGGEGRCQRPLPSMSWKIQAASRVLAKSAVIPR